ncbi:MAG TPA: Si-specific NAD(P)(+) transhydrogenase [Blastocatellia bacterium]|nr:Si-specific NAD(P)(+) transhydrogenase [Blastocatellia bacterium]
MTKTPTSFDLVVIGSGPAGQKGAIAAAKLGKRVAILDRREMLGGVCLHTGTIPSKTLREAIIYLTGFRQRAFYGKDYTLKADVSADDLESRVRTVVEREMAVIRDQLRRNGAETFTGTARFTDPHTIEVEGEQGIDTLNAGHVLIACGTRPARPADMPFDGEQVMDADQLPKVDKIPRELIVVGAGVIGIEYASMLTALDVEVTLVDQHSTLLDFVDQEIVEALCYQMRRRGTIFRLGEKVIGVEIEQDGMVHAHTESGKRLHAHGLLYAVGRQANTDTLNLEAAGLKADARGRIKVDEYFQTEAPHIYAAGDCIGFPALASTAMEQGRLAAHHMFLGPSNIKHYDFPYGIYTIPEVSMIGKTEHELTEAKSPYEIGVAKYEEIAKGQMAGDDIGMLKILFDPDTLKILGVHAVGENATEIIHIGQTVMALDGTIEFFRDSVFNYPTFAEAYKVAALNGLNRL